MASADTRPVSPAEALEAFRPSKGRVGVALAVSGGADSLALLHLWADALALDPDLPPAVVLTVDHGLRPESSAEAKFVAEAAASRGLSHEILVWEGEKPTADIEAVARAHRRRLLLDAVRARGFDTLILAHHADDQAETFLSRLARGSGVRGLAAMAKAHLVEGVLLFRPFLDLPRSRFAATLAARGATWVEDASNADPRFERTRLRAAAADLARLGLTRERLVATAAAMARASAAIEGLVDDLTDAAALFHPLGFVRVEAAAFVAAPDEVRLRLLARLIAGFGDAEHAPRLEALEAVDSAMRDGEGPVVRTLGGVRVERRRGHLWFAPEAGRTSVATLRPGESIRCGGRRFSLAADTAGPVEIAPLGREGRLNLVEAGVFAPSLLGTPEPSAALVEGLVAVRHADAVPVLPGTEGAVRVAGLAIGPLLASERRRR